MFIGPTVSDRWWLATVVQAHAAASVRTSNSCIQLPPKVPLNGSLGDVGDVLNGLGAWDVRVTAVVG